MTVPFGSILLKNSVASTAPGLPVSLTSAFDFERIVAVKRSEPNCGKQDFAGGQARNLAPEFFNRIGRNLPLENPLPLCHQRMPRSFNPVPAIARAGGTALPVRRAG